MLHISNAIYLEKKTHAKMTKNSLTGKTCVNINKNKTDICEVKMHFQ